LWKRDPVLAGLSAAIGVLAGLVQAFGLIRWVMLVPSLAATYTGSGATEIERAMAVSIFDAANRYLGVGVGEHLGYLFTGVWTLLISALIFQGRRILALLGTFISLGVMAGMLEPFGAPMAADINAIGFSLWALWALWLGAAFLLEGRGLAPSPAAA
jgi:hypothetical protein